MQAGSPPEDLNMIELAALCSLHMSSPPACSTLFERSLGHWKGALAVPLPLHNVLKLQYTELGTLINTLK